MLCLIFPKQGTVHNDQTSPSWSHQSKGYCSKTFMACSVLQTLVMMYILLGFFFFRKSRTCSVLFWSCINIQCVYRSCSLYLWLYFRSKDGAWKIWSLYYKHTGANKFLAKKENESCYSSWYLELHGKQTPSEFGSWWCHSSGDAQELAEPRAVNRQSRRQVYQRNDKPYHSPQLIYGGKSDCSSTNPFLSSVSVADRLLRFIQS